MGVLYTLIVNEVRRLLIILVLLLPLCGTFGQVNVTIRGESANAAGKRVEMLCYEDMLSMHERVLDEAIVDSTGAFTLGCYLTYPRLVVVQVECYSQSFYVEPGRRYEVWLPSFRWEQDEEHNVYLDPVALPLEFLNLPKDELNVKILHFDEAVDSFISEHRMYFDPRFKPRRQWMDSLELRVKSSELRMDGDDFFSRYTRFTLAQMRYDMGFASRKQMLDNVLPQPILYHDECYMRTLLDVLGGMVSQGMKKVGKWRLIEWVHQGNLDRYLDSLGTEPLLYDEQLRELAALVALKESLYDPDYDHDGALRMLVALAQRSKWKEHRRMAESVVSGIWQEESGERKKEIATLALPDVDGNKVCLDSLRGKWVYMSFVRVGDPNSLRELETLAHFKDSVYAQNDNVVFVSVACDREFQKMYHLLRNSRRGARYTWTWLHFDGQYRWLESLGVVSYPWFILLDPEGRQPYSVTPAPGSGFLLHAPWERHGEERPKLEFTD